MRRRDIVLLAGAALVAPRLAGAQQAERMRHIGFLAPTTGSPENVFGVLQTRALVEALRNLEWYDGRNVTVDHRYTGSGRERIRQTAKDLVATNPDVILSVGGPALAALLAETRTIPIVFTNVADPVGSGLVPNLSHPGGNATGFSTMEAPLAGKWVQLLKEMAPAVTRALVLVEQDNPSQRLDAEAILAAAPVVGVISVVAPVGDISDYERHIASFAREPGGGLIVPPNVLANNNLHRVEALAAQHRLPAVYSYPIYTRNGGLFSYGPDNLALIRQAAGYIDKILHGAKPGDLPIEQPSRFVLAVNLKTAKALGLVVPQSILARADEVIE